MPESNPQTSLVRVARSRAQSHPDRTVYTFSSDGAVATDQLTYAALDARARAVAGYLQRQCQPGDRALLLYPPGLEFVTAFFGCAYSGIIAVPAYPPRGGRIDDRIREIARDSRPAIVLTTAALAEGLQAGVSSDEAFAGAAWASTDLAIASGAPWREHDPQPTDILHLQYTSGSTATPKGVMVTHGNVIANLVDMDRGWVHDESSVIVSWLPHFHDMGLVYGLLEAPWVGATAHLMPPVAFIQRPVRWLQAISRLGATHSAAPNFAYDLCVRKVKPADREGLDLSRWKVAVNGAEPIRWETLEQFATTFAPCGFQPEVLCPGYGLAEATLKVTSSNRGVRPVKQAFSGAALDQGRVVPGAEGSADARELVGCGASSIGTEVVMVDPATSQVCAPGVIGEIWVAGDIVAVGYWQKPEATSVTFAARTADGRAPFLRTGDLGFVHEGQLFVTGRLKDLLIVRGQNHYPQDIERTVERSHAALRPNSGAAFSVDLAGEERVVIAQEVERTERNIDAAELAGTIRQAVAEAHEIAVHDVVLLRAGAIPKTSSGKIQRQACRRAYLENTFEGRLEETAL